MKVAAVQFAPTYGDKLGNLRKVARLVLHAAENGARLIVLPELVTTGYSFMGEEDAIPVAEEISLNSLTMKAMHALASAYNVHLVWGMVEREVGTNKLYNSQVYIDPTGYFESYRKVNLWGNDILWAHEGKGNPPVIRAKFEAGIGEPSTTLRVGLLICRDVRNKKDDKWTDFYESGDADVVCFSANWGNGGFPSTTWWDFAKDNNTWLIVANRYGKEVPNDFGEGGICVIEPSGKVHCDGLKGHWLQDCVVYCDIPT
jgi:predicted amidohydrolase